MFDDAGEPIPHPLVENQRSLRLDGYVIAYCIPTEDDQCRIAYLSRYQALPKAIYDQAIELVTKEFLPVAGVDTPLAPIPKEPEDG